jgi:hypothetical protein
LLALAFPADLAVAQVIAPTNAPPRRLSLSARTTPTPQAQPALKAGIYLTVPYAGIVLVPATGIDDDFVINPGRPCFSMPVIPPDLQFVPRPPKK